MPMTAVLPVPAPTAPPAASDVAALHEALAYAAALALSAHARTGRSVLDELVEGPIAPSGPDDQAQIQAAANLYLAAQLEKARVIPVVEMLSGVGTSGGLPVDLGAAGSAIAAFWRTRNDRMHANERSAFFDRLFGADDTAAPAAGGSDFDMRMIDVCEALYKIDEESAGSNQPTPQAMVKVQVAAQALADSLLQRAGGMTAFAAGEILRSLQQAIAILQQLAKQHLFGARILWDVVRTLLNRYGEDEPRMMNYVGRGRSGMMVWLRLSAEIESSAFVPPSSLTPLDAPC